MRKFFVLFAFLFSFSCFAQLDLIHSNTATLNLSETCDGSFNDFNFQWSGYDDQKIIFSLDRGSVLSSNVILTSFRMCSPKDGTIYLELSKSPVYVDDDADITLSGLFTNITEIYNTSDSSLTNRVQYIFGVASTNIPPRRSYYSELLLTFSSNTNLQRSAAQGMVIVTHSLYNNDEDYFVSDRTNAQVGQIYIHPGWTYLPYGWGQWVLTNEFSGTNAGLQSQIDIIEGLAESNQTDIAVLTTGKVDQVDFLVHTSATGTNIHGLGTMSTASTDDYYTASATDSLLAGKTDTNTTALLDARVMNVEGLAKTNQTDIAVLVTGKVDHVDFIILHGLAETNQSDISVLTTGKVDLVTYEAHLIDQANTNSGLQAQIDTKVFTNDTRRLDWVGADLRIIDSVYSNNPVTRKELNDAIDSVAHVVLYGATNSHPSISGGSLWRGVPSESWEITSSLTDGTNNVGTFWLTNTIDLIREGQYIGRLYAQKTGGTKIVNAYIRLIYSNDDGVTTNIINQSAQSGEIGTGITSYRITVNNPTNIVETNLWLGVCYYFVQSGGGADCTIVTYGGTPYDTHLDTPGLGVAAGYATQSSVDALDARVTDVEGLAGTNQTRIIAIENQTHVNTLNSITGGVQIVGRTNTTVQTDGTNIYFDSTGGIADLSGWSGYPATQAVDFASFTPYGIGTPGYYIGSGFYAENDSQIKIMFDDTTMTAVKKSDMQMKNLSITWFGVSNLYSAELLPRRGFAFVPNGNYGADAFSKGIFLGENGTSSQNCVAVDCYPIQGLNLAINGNAGFSGNMTVGGTSTLNNATVSTLQITGGNPTNGAVWVVTNTAGQGAVKLLSYMRVGPSGTYFETNVSTSVKFNTTPVISRGNGFTAVTNGIKCNRDMVIRASGLVDLDNVNGLGANMSLMAGADIVGYMEYLDKQTINNGVPLSIPSIIESVSADDVLRLVVKVTSGSATNQVFNYKANITVEELP